MCRPQGEMGIQASALPVQEVPRPKGATDFELGAYTGWEFIESLTEDCPGRGHTVAIEVAGVLYTMGFISDSEAEEPIFQQILATFKVS